VAEHAAAAATTAAAQAVPFREGSEIIMAVAPPAEWTAASVTSARIIGIAIPVKCVEPVHGVERMVEFVVQVHEQDSILLRAYLRYI
jgi:hypothetical protein